MTSAWLAGGMALESSAVNVHEPWVEALCSHPLAKGPFAGAGGGAGAWVGWMLWQPMWEVPICCGYGSRGLERRRCLRVGVELFQGSGG